MSSSNKTVILFFVVWRVLTNLHALEFETKKISHNAKLKDKEFLATFKFKNKSGKPVHIEKIESSCNCIVAKLQKNKINTGDSGKLEINYQFRNKTGLQQNRIKVFINGSIKPVVLVIEVNIPTPYKFSKRFEIWNNGEQSQRKIQLTLHEDFKAKVQFDKKANDKIPFISNLQKIDAKSFILSFSPNSPNTKGRYQAKIIFSRENEPDLVSYIFLISQ